MKGGSSISTVEGASASFIEIGRKGEIKGPIRANEIIIGKDAHVEDIHGKRILLKSGAQAQNVYGESVTIEPHCYVSGEINYTSELRIAEATLPRTPRKVAQLPS